MKVGDYVRLDRYQGIRKIDDYDEEIKEYFLDGDIYDEWGDLTLKLEKYDVVKFSPNIIDLIEVGDYVNGYKVSFVDEEPVLGKFVQCDYAVQYGTTNHYRFYEREIKSIVTKEQFAIMEYKVN